MEDSQKFLFFTCQVGAEGVLKAELARLRPEIRFAFSRPGFLTYKVPPRLDLPENFRLRAVFARSYGFAVGKASLAADEVWKIAPPGEYRRIHVWPRDTAEPGRHGYEPGMTPEAVSLHEDLRRLCPNPAALAESDSDPDEPTEAGDLILDCVIVDPGVCWVGYHRAGGFSSRWPGGILPLKLPEDAVSRAWLKMEEALRWSRLPIRAGNRVAEIGSAPGGASQALLSRGLLVTGIDPAEMSPVVLENPNFTHVRRRSTQVRRREFRKIRWLTADMNVAPNYTLDAVEAIVTYPEVNVRGMILTLKLSDWSLAQHIPEYLEHIRGWGYEVVRARQLLYNRQEICVAAMRSAVRRVSSKPGKGRRTEQPES